jgi:hypothetical protein
VLSCLDNSKRIQVSSIYDKDKTQILNEWGHTKGVYIEVQVFND